MMIEEEWLIKGIGLNLLQTHNLFPTREKPVQVKKAYEAFLRFDDKPLIVNVEAFRNSVLRYCQNGAFALAAGDEDFYTNVWFKETPAFFDVEDESYWMVDPSEYETYRESAEEEELGGDAASGGNVIQDSAPISGDGSSSRTDVELDHKIYERLRISGKVNLIDMADVLNFARALRDNNVRINIEIEAHSTESSPISENSKQFTIAKESAKQLGLKFEAEEKETL